MSDATSYPTIAATDVSTEQVADLRQRLLAWYAANGRDLPWRHTRDPYHILVSEIMLQQTQVDRVLPRYAAFLERFPTIEALAAAPTAEVIRLWSGLGYNRRAVNLQRAARAVVEQYGSTVPRTVTELLKLPGVGPYTAGAVACFAYEQDVGFVDTNIRRVLHRLFVGPESAEQRATSRAIQQLAERLVPPGEGYNWNQALIEFGAIQCTARKPACGDCPLREACRAFPVMVSAPLGAPRPSTGSAVPYERSTRYYRGRVITALRELRDGESYDLARLGPRIRDDYGPEHLPWLQAIVAGLERDGLARIAEDSPGYDADEPATVRVHLPTEP